MIRLLVRVCAPFLLLCLASWAHAQELPRISEFYFDEDTLVARPIVAIEGDDEATIAKLVKTMERGGRHVDKAIAQLAHIAMASGRTDTGKVLYARAMDAASSSVMRNSIAWNHGWDLYRAGDYEGALEQWVQAFANRGAPYLFGIEANWAQEADSERNLAWVRETFADLRRFSTGGVYLNFPGFLEEGTQLLRAGYGGNYERLSAVKAAYDPGNLFRFNANIQPSARPSA